MAEALSPEEQILALRRALAERDATIAALTTGLAAEQAANEARRAEAVIVKAKLTTVLLEIEHMKMQLASLRRQRYGQSSEKLDRDIAQLEMRLEDLEETAGEQIAADPKPAALESEAGPQTTKPQRKPAGRKPLPEHLPREIVVHEPEITCICGSCDPARPRRSWPARRAARQRRGGHHALGVDGILRQTDRFGDPQAGRVANRQNYPVLWAPDRDEKPVDLFRAHHDG